MNNTCVHAVLPYSPQGETMSGLAHDPALLCGRRPFLRIHGYLCFDHYKAQQREIPSAPRLPQQFYIPREARVLTDDQLVAEIIRYETQRIATARVQRVVLGRTDPIVLRFVQ